MRKGLAVSPGVSVGTAYCVQEIFVNPQATRIQDGDVNAELERFDRARDKAAEDLRVLQKKVLQQVGPREAAIFGAHESILRDAALAHKVRERIAKERVPAQSALQSLLEEYTAVFTQTDDEYLRERLADIRDVVERLSAHLSDVLQPQRSPLKGPLIVVADELLPSQVVALGNLPVKGIVTQSGGQTSHAAIIARSRGIPAVAAVKNVLRHVRTGDTIVVDGREGHVLVRPDAEALAAYRKLEREFFDLRDHLAENRDQPAVTADGTRLELLANINGPADAQAALAMRAAGVGLFRTEYIYLRHRDVPEEEEQFEIYRQVVQEAPNHSVTIRTLDIGGDKTVPYLGHRHQEANPFMGWRSIRLSFEHPQFFTTQVRAVFRAAAEADRLGGQVQLMFPMITTLEEMRRVRNMVTRIRRQMNADGIKPGRVPLGMMLEVPAAAVTIDTMLEAVDFVSIGSNDLVQYLMAADRDNPKVSHLCQPLSPPVLLVLRQVIEACNRSRTRVTLCGEMAGKQRAFVLLLGMGLRNFSMSPAFIPLIKDLASHVTVGQAENIMHAAFKLKTTAQVNRFMADQLARLAPNLAMLDTD